MNMRPTLPRGPWDYTPSEEAISRAREELAKASPTTRLAASVFTSGLNLSDLRYVALAVLQLHDENRGLRERIRILEERSKA